MNSLMLLWKWVADESATRCCTSATRDWKTVTLRTENEGLSFLTITLPAFGKDFERSLDEGRVGHDMFLGFKRHGGLPRFLGGFLDLVFDRGSGVLLDKPNIDAIRSVRQLTLMFGKIAIKCSSERERAAMKGYIETEHEVRLADTNRTSSDMLDFQRISRMLFTDLLTKVDREVYNGTLIPKHGPGATADKLTGNGKYRQRNWPHRLDKYFPIGDYLIPSPSYFEELDDVDFVEPGAEMPVKVISVPKTLKTPRIIAMEPTAMQYAQQAIYGTLLDNLEQDKFLYKVIGFDDQVPNQDMAREGSHLGHLATLDMSEASDRVSNQLVRALLNDHVHLHDAVDSCRSRKADVLGHGVIRLAKFASMGSALCFPMEAMVFATLVFVGIDRARSTPLTPQSIKEYEGLVRVYGDDLIVPVEYVRSVVDTLTSFGMKVNVGKSFWTGKFRESCGKEYFDGEDVSIVRVRKELPTRRTDATEVISLVEFRNQLYWAGYWKTCGLLDESIRAMLKHYPVVESTSSVLGRESVFSWKAEATDPDTFAPLVRGWRVKAKPPRDFLDGPPALLKCHLRMAARDRGVLPKSRNLDHLSPAESDDHLERSGRPQTVGIKLGFATPY